MNDTKSLPLFPSPQKVALDNYNDFSPDLDYLDGENSFDFEDADLGGQMLGALPGRVGDDTTPGRAEQHDKRKNPDEDDEAEENDAKRQETQEGERGAKKPGRKPLTSEPTTKRKAQNRAAQRAFRERKEKHLKDLEIKVDELTKQQEADDRKKRLLQEKVDRLEAELKAERKRVSLGGGLVSRSPPLAAASGQRNHSASKAINDANFSFDFPKFGGLPGSQIFGDHPTATKPGSVSPLTSVGRAMSGVSQHGSRPGRESSASHSTSPLTTPGLTASPAHLKTMMPNVGYSTIDNMHGFAGTLPQMSDNDILGDLFSPSILKTGSMNGEDFFGISQPTAPLNSNGNDSTSGLTRAFQFNRGSSASDSASPSTTSSSRWNANGANSSCGTSPEPSHDSPGSKEKPIDSFDDKVGGAQNWLPNQFTTSIPDTQVTNYHVPSATTFDPLLFDNYRDNNDSFLGNNDFGGGFFDEALQSAPYDFGSPSNLFGILQSPPPTNAQLLNNAPTPSRNLMAEVEKTRDGGDEDYARPSAATSDKKLVSCNNIWNQLQSNPEYQDGKFDLDNLCSELRAKARCSEAGVVIPQHHVQAALHKLGGRTDEKHHTTKPSNLMHEPESWENLVKKMGGAK